LWAVCCVKQRLWELRESVTDLALSKDAGLCIRQNW